MDNFPGEEKWVAHHKGFYLTSRASAIGNAPFQNKHSFFLGRSNLTPHTVPNDHSGTVTKFPMKMGSL